MLPGEIPGYGNCTSRSATPPHYMWRYPERYGGQVYFSDPELGSSLVLLGGSRIWYVGLASDAGRLLIYRAGNHDV